MKRTAALILACLPALALAVEMPPIRYMATIEGHCEALLRDGQPVGHCKDAVLNWAYTTNRVSFFFFTDEKNIIVFSGGQDEQPSPDFYRLTLTNVNIDQKQIGAEGSCEVHGDISLGAEILCKAATQTEPATHYEARFKSIGAPKVARP